MPSPVSSLLGIFSRDLGIDAGSANTLVYARNRGIVLFEPSVAVLEKSSGKLVAIGSEAVSTLSKSPEPDGLEALHPFRDRQTTDPKWIRQLLHHFISRVQLTNRYPARPRVVIGVANDIPEAQKRAMKEAASSAGAREVYTIEEPMAAGIGAGLPVNEPVGSMVVDIGVASTDTAILSLGGIALSYSSKVAGDQIDQAIVRYARDKHNLVLSNRMAESAKIVAGTAVPLKERRSVTLRGVDASTGERQQVEVTSMDLHEAIVEPVDSIVQIVRQTLDEAPAELVNDVLEFGITLTGGGALLTGLPERIAAETRMPVQVADNPLTCVVRGAGMVVESLDEFSAVLKATRHAGKQN